MGLTSFGMRCACINAGHILALLKLLFENIFLYIYMKRVYPSECINSVEFMLCSAEKRNNNTKVIWKGISIVYKFYLIFIAYFKRTDTWLNHTLCMTVCVCDTRKDYIKRVRLLMVCIFKSFVCLFFSLFLFSFKKYDDRFNSIFENSDYIKI